MDLGRAASEGECEDEMHLHLGGRILVTFDALAPGRAHSGSIWSPGPCDRDPGQSCLRFRMHLSLTEMKTYFMGRGR